MRWLVLLLLLLLLANCSTGAVIHTEPQPARPSPRGFIQDITVYVTRNYLEDRAHEWMVADFRELMVAAEIAKLKHQLQRHGYRSENCTAGRAVIARAAQRTSVGGFPSLAEQAKVIERQECQVGGPGDRIFSAELLVDRDPELQNRRSATLRFLPLGGGQPISGGYAHRTGEVLSWDDVISRAIERTLGGYNEATAVRVRYPSEAEVGDTVRLDASGSWDRDGDPFELRWKVSTRACVSKGRVLPSDGRGCGNGEAKSQVIVPSQAGEGDQHREFLVPVVGDYEVAVHSKVGVHDEPSRVLLIRARPRRSNAILSSLSYLTLPTDFLTSSGKPQSALLMRAGYLRRLTHRIGLFGLFEEIHLGVSLGSMQEVRSWNVPPSASATVLGVDVLVRALDRSGRYGFANSYFLGGGYLIARRGEQERTEGTWMAQSVFGGYFSFGENYVNSPVAYCTVWCPSVTLGPAIAVLGNAATSKVAVVGGLEFVMAPEF